MTKISIDQVLCHKITKKLFRFIFAGGIVWLASYIILGGGAEWMVREKFGADNSHYPWLALSIKISYVIITIAVLSETFGLDRYDLWGVSLGFFGILWLVLLGVISLALFVLLIWSVFEYPNQVTAIFTIAIFCHLYKHLR